MGTLTGGLSRFETEKLNPSLQQFIQMVRYWMRDFPELNRLVDGEEHTDRMILWATLDAVNDFNTSPPLVTMRFEQIPPSLLKYGVAITLLESLTFLAARNSLSYSDGGTNINIDKTGQLMQMRQMMQSAYEEKKQRYKVAINISQGYDSISSEYRLLAGYYGAW